MKPTKKKCADCKELKDAGPTKTYGPDVNLCFECLVARLHSEIPRGTITPG